MTRAITLNAQEVRAILAGELTELWRPIAPKTAEYFGDSAVVAMTTGHTGPGWYMWSDEYPDEGSSYLECPFGRPYDQLWVRETWALVYLDYDYESGHCDDVWGVSPIPKNDPRDKSKYCKQPRYAVPYRADTTWDGQSVDERGFEWRSPVTMPKWASRLALTNESVDAIKVDDTWQWRVTFKRKDKSE